MHTITQANSFEEADDDGLCPVNSCVIAKHQQDNQVCQALLQSQDYEQQHIHNVNLIFYKQNTIAPPSTLVDAIIALYHEMINHPGVDRTYRTISAHFYSRDMEARVCHLIC